MYRLSKYHQGMMRLLSAVALLVALLPPLVSSQALNRTQGSITTAYITQPPLASIPDDAPTSYTPEDPQEPATNDGDGAIVEGNQDSLAEASPCLSPTLHFDPFLHKSHYEIGVIAIRGFEAAQEAYNLTFGEYLSATAGKRFDTPITFEMVPYDFEGIFSAIDNGEVDFFFANPGVYSCIGTEVGASPLATVVSRLEVRGHQYELDVFGGVIVTRADNLEINGIHDLKDKIIGAGDISTLMAAQVQFHEMQKAGMSYVDDPKQVVFTGNQFDVVNGVLSGEFDVGFVRTDTIERTEDGRGGFIDSGLLKVIEPKIYVLDDGFLFPFLHSTPIYPEWPVAALPSVPQDIAEEVALALLHLGNYASVGQSLEKCVMNGDGCDSMSFPKDFDPDAPCDTTRPIAEVAWEASKAGKLAGFRTARSYFDVRAMQQDAGFLQQDDKGDWKCTRVSNVYDGLTCPEGHYKRSEAQFEKSCNRIGLECKQGYDCYCKPCVKAFEVDVYEHAEGDEDIHLIDYFGTDLGGCEKMSVCGTVEQTKSITFRAFDNKQRENAEVTVLMHTGDTPKWLPVTQVPNTFAYEFTMLERLAGIEVFEVYVDGKQISQSPLRVEFIDLDCDYIHGISSNRVADFDGTCICSNDTFEIGGRCMGSPSFFVMIFSAVFIVLLGVLSSYLTYKRKQNDSIWHVNVDELVFDETPKIIGQGAFGVVILAEYRGTRVAVKRVLPSRVSQKDHGASSKSVSSKSGEAMEGSKDSVKLVSFHDVEDPKEKGMVKRHNSHDSGNMSGSLGIDHILPMGNTNSILKLLGSATLSSQGRGDIFGQGTMASQKHSWMPYWLRFDEHSKQTREFVIEMRLLSRLRHPCITTVMGAVVSPTVDPMLVMEFMDYGSLYDILHNKTMYTGGEIILQVVRDVAQGIRFLHESKPPILHGDLKAKNILVDSRFRAKVADFGLSHLSGNKGALQGTPFFMAPEYLRRRSEYNTACDMYSLGMIFYEIYARGDPFEGENPEKILPKVCHPRINLRPPVPDNCPHKMAELMKKLWSANPFFRPSAKDLEFILLDIHAQEAEPLEKKTPLFVENSRQQKTAKELLYDVFPKHIADALNAGQRVEPESHELVTVFFSDIVGFTDISSTFSAMKVSMMLDRLYRAFDTLSSKHKVFKVETIGDAWMGVTNLDDSQMDTHAKSIAEFAIDAIATASRIPIDEEEPDRGFIQIRVGFHSGPVVTNVIGTLNPRYGLFGDTVNTSSRMESNSKPGQILCSEASAALLAEQAPDIDLRKRGHIQVKGKGGMATYWVGVEQISTLMESNLCFESIPNTDGTDHIIQKVGAPVQAAKESDSNMLQKDDIISNRGGVSSKAFVDKPIKMISLETCETESITNSSIGNDESMCKIETLINFDVELLVRYLKRVLAKRQAQGTAKPMGPKPIYGASSEGKTTLDEFQDQIQLPEFDLATANNQIDPDSIELDLLVVSELREYVSVIASLYRPNPFHSFEHANHALVAVEKLLHWIVMPQHDRDDDHNNGNSRRISSKVAADLHRSSYGISSDPLAQFACIFSVLIHDVDHPGVANAVLVNEKSTLAQAYNNQSVAEQNSVDLSWELLMTDRYTNFRNCAFANDDDLFRFRQLVVNMIMATDLADKETAKKITTRWDKAFPATVQQQNQQQQDQQHPPSKKEIDLKATVVLERLIQVSDVSHTMQEFYVFQKWNERLFFELYGSFHKGRLLVEKDDPSKNWYQGELDFFDYYIIPYAKKLDACGIFGDLQLVQYAIANRKGWEMNGEEIVVAYKKKFNIMYPSLVCHPPDQHKSHEQQQQENVSKHTPPRRKLSSEWGDSSAGNLANIV